MAKILHLLTKKDDALAAEVVALQKAEGHTVELLDMTVEAPDYGAVVKKIFGADSVETW